MLGLGNLPSAAPSDHPVPLGSWNPGPGMNKNSMVPCICDLSKKRKRGVYLCHTMARGCCVLHAQSHTGPYF